MTLSNDPWKDLKPPSATDVLNAKRVDADIPWGFFWARGVDHRYLLLVRHSTNSTPQGHLPRMKGIDVAVVDAGREGERALVLKLVDSAQKDIFHKLCIDIVSSASKATSEKEAVEVALARTWRWHHLLRGGSDGRLSPEEQKGLIGELLFIEHHLLSEISAFDAVSSWRGPKDAPKDFEIGRICVEAKARRGSATPYVAISSEYQLDESGTDVLFLYVVELDQAPLDTDAGSCVSDVVERVRTSIVKADVVAGEAFEGLLFAAGFRWEDDYSDCKWIEGIHKLYIVDADFPRITPASLRAGVSNVKYSILLTMCEPFCTTDDALYSAIEGNHGN